MTLYALDDLDDALDVTRAFLTPIDRTKWVKLALIAFFVGLPGTNLNIFQSGVGGDGAAPQQPDGLVVPDVGPEVWLAVAAVVGLGVLVALAFAVVGSVMEFVFVEALRDDEVTVRRFWSRRWRQGLRLLGFRILLGLLVFGSVLLLSAPFVLPLLGFGAIGGDLSIAFFVVLLPLFLVLAIVAGLVNGFTTAFVVPIMILEDCGVLAGWRRLWSTITPNWTQYLAYAVSGFFLSILGGILVGILTAVLAILLLIPFGVLAAIGAGLFVLFEPIGAALLVLVGLLFGLAVLLAAGLALVPVQTYLRYYALLVLGDVDSRFDLIPERRAAVRETPTGSDPTTP